ncbi:alpha/beta hydrolase [Pseudomonas boanensis]|uniref:alpha/beta hydrolase n=1 Tax=Metapseudomonas boanensis TaxID=2822138 RepID=UPI0035D476E7
MTRTLASIALLIAVVYLGLCVALFVFQRALIYFPQPRLAGGPDTVLKMPLVDVEIVVSTRLHEGPKALIYFGGNAEDVSWNLSSFAEAFPDHALYLMHYRGFGGSSGSPSEEAIQQDALALFDRVQALHPEVLLVGRSLGSGVAIRLASQRPASRLVLVTPYNSIEELAQEQFAIFPVRWLLRDKFESWRYAPGINVPTQVIMAEHDEVIPRWSTEKLLRQFSPGVATMAVIRGKGHNTVSDSPEYLRLLRSTP